MSAQPPPPPPPRGGMSLYANLLDPSSSTDNNTGSGSGSAATISRAPVVFKPADAGESSFTKDESGTSSGPKKDLSAAFRFQQPMIRRPVVPQQKKTGVKPIISFPKAAPAPPCPPLPPPPPPGAAPSGAAVQQGFTGDETRECPKGQGKQPRPAAKSTLADWTAVREDEGYNASAGPSGFEHKRKRKKKNKKNEEQATGTDWNEMYDPSRPTNVEEYMRSDERIREVREWKEVLYRHRMSKEKEGEQDEGSVCSEDEGGSWEESRGKNNSFAPPSSYNFAPPPPSPLRAKVVDDATGEDAYSRRLGLSRGAPAPPPRDPSSPSVPPPAPPAIASEEAAAISRAPVRYTTQPAPEPMDQDTIEEDREDDQYSPPPSLGMGTTSSDPPHAPPKSNRPGQAGFAQRLMSKYGWSAGTGLGASESGIIHPLQVRVEKSSSSSQRRRKKPDSEGGGWADPPPPPRRAKIIGGQVSKAVRERQEAESFGSMSEVIVLSGMLENMTDDELAGELQEGELQQEIGEECGEEYGRVERLHIDTAGKGVYIKFTDQVSALRAVNSLQGRIFNGNAIVAKFFDSDKFEARDFS